MARVFEMLVRFGLLHPRARSVVAHVHNGLAFNSRRVRGGNTVQASEAFLRRCCWDIAGVGNIVQIGSGAQLSRTKLFIRGDRNKVIVGEECLFKAASLHIEGNDCTIQIGAETTVVDAHLAATESTSVAMGKDCMLAFGIDIRSGDSHAIFDKEQGVRLNDAANVVIGDHVWVAPQVTILKGSVVGSGSVIGARSVVTGGIPRDSIACGIPAKVVRSGVKWTRSLDGVREM